MTRRCPFKCFETSPKIMGLAVMLYIRFPLSLQMVEDLLHECGIDVSYETVRFWWHRFGPMFAAETRKRRIQGMRSSRWRWNLDEMFVKNNGERHYLWRAVDHEGEVLESFVTKTRDKDAALKFLRKAMKKHGQPVAIVTDRLRSYGSALTELGASGRQETGRWTNNRAENSHLRFRRRERAMLRFLRMRSLQKFAAVHASVYNQFQPETQPLLPQPFQAEPRCRSCGVAPAGRGIKGSPIVHSETLSNSSDTTRRFPDQILSRTWDGRTRIYNLHKDVGMAVALAEELGSPMRIGHQTLAWIPAAIIAGMADEDFARMYFALDKLAVN